MTDKYVLVRDMVADHRERMGNIKKYYPYFKLFETDFSLYQNGKYACLDMGYILMAVLRFFIEENNFKEKDVTYEEYSSFMREIYERDFGLTLEEAEEQSLSSYIFDKIRNEGKPFVFSYYDPEEQKKKNVRIRWIDSKIKEEKVYYYLTGEAIEFYLETKEVKDESKINMSQLLLSKMIASKNFKGGIEVVRRINHQVIRLKMQKDQVLKILGSDVFTGVKEYEKFMNHGIRWFQEEQKMFAKNMELIDEALKRADGEAYGDTIREISQLEQELKHALANHSDLLNACTKLQIQADELIARAKFSKLKKSFDFDMAAAQMVKNGDASVLQALVEPLFRLHAKKSFPLFRVENLLTLRMGREENAEVIEEKEEVEYVTEDEKEETRIGHNFEIYLRLLLYYISIREKFDVDALSWYIQEITGEDVYCQSDYYAMLTHLAQKESYDMDKILEKPETFLEEYMAKTCRENPQYKPLRFFLDFSGAEELQTKEGCTILNFQIYRGENDDRIG